MIPKIIHYCWFGRGEMPETVAYCVESWHRYMPDYEYVLWNEDSFDLGDNQYAKEAYQAKKYAFVSDYVRLFALYHYGGIYFDTDVEVFKPFDDLLDNKAFGGFEGSKIMPLGTCVLASEKGGDWVKEQLDYYRDRHFVSEDGTYDLTTNVRFITERMKEQGFVQDGKEQYFKDLHVYPVEYFCPRRTTGEYFRTENTYCDHLGIGSWAENGGWKDRFGKLVGQKNMIRLIKLKRKLIG